jgi:hypothetical protein
MTPEREGKVKRHTHGETGNDEMVDGSKKDAKNVFYFSDDIVRWMGGRTRVGFVMRGCSGVERNHWDGIEPHACCMYVCMYVCEQCFEVQNLGRVWDGQKEIEEWSWRRR